jgi:hypothetical protein
MQYNWRESEPKKSLSTAREKNSLLEVLDEKIKMYSRYIDHAGMYASQIYTFEQRKVTFVVVSRWLMRPVVPASYM